MPIPILPASLIPFEDEPSAASDVAAASVDEADVELLVVLVGTAVKLADVSDVVDVASVVDVAEASDVVDVFGYHDSCQHFHYS